MKRDHTTPGATLRRVARRWWPLLAFVAAAYVAQSLLVDRYDVGGHAYEHLMSASAPCMAAAVVGVLFWTTPAARRQLDVLVSSAAWLASTVAVMVGNLRVVDDLVATGNARTPTSAVPDVADHDLANASVWIAYIAALTLLVAWGGRRHIRRRATVTAVIVSLLVPPWIVPGAGAVLLAILRVGAFGASRTDAVGTLTVEPSP